MENRFVVVTREVRSETGRIIFPEREVSARTRWEAEECRRVLAEKIPDRQHDIRERS